MSGYPTWANEPPIWSKVNALGGTFDPGNPYDAGYDAALGDALKLIEADLLTNAARDLLGALDELQAVFALPDEDSFYRFERLAAMFHKDTGYLAPGKSAPMYSSQPDGDELRAVYDAWYNAKVARARAAIAKATGA